MIKRKNVPVEKVSRQELADRILNAYSAWYDIKRTAPEDAPLIATADFHERQSGYMLVRKAEMWTANRHEYVYIYSVDTLTPEIFETCMQQTRSLGDIRVEPVKGHMSTNIVALFICDSAEEAAVTALKKYRYRKSFQFSLRGWMEVHTAVVENGRNCVTANGPAHNTRDFLKKIIVGH